MDAIVTLAGVVVMVSAVVAVSMGTLAGVLRGDEACEPEGTRELPRVPRARTHAAKGGGGGGRLDVTA